MMFYNQLIEMHEIIMHISSVKAGSVISVTCIQMERVFNTRCDYEVIYGSVN